MMLLFFLSSIVSAILYTICSSIYTLSFLFLFIRNMVFTRNSAQFEEEPIIADPPQGMPNTRGKRIKIVASKKKR